MQNNKRQWNDIEIKKYNQEVIDGLGQLAQTFLEKTQEKTFALAHPNFGIVLFAVPGTESKNGWYKSYKGLHVKADDLIGKIEVENSLLNIFDWVDWIDSNNQIPEIVEAQQISFVDVGSH